MKGHFLVMVDVACKFDLKSLPASSVAEVPLQDSGPVTVVHMGGTFQEKMQEVYKRFNTEIGMFNIKVYRMLWNSSEHCWLAGEVIGA